MERISSQVSTGGQLNEVDYAKEVAETHVDGTRSGPAELPAVAPLQSNEMAALVAPQRSAPFEGPQAQRPIGLPPDVISVASALRRSKTSSKGLSDAISQMPEAEKKHLSGSMSRRDNMFHLIGPMVSMMEGIYANLKTSG